MSAPWPRLAALLLLIGAAPIMSACDTLAPDRARPSAEPSSPAQRAGDAGFAPPKGVVERLFLQARMRDGVRLNTSVWLPSDQGRFPAVLIRTPYRSEMDEFEERLLQEGYAVVQQHERGRYFSEGEMRMLNRAAEDGWDTLSWIAEQDWSNGRIATYGCSSSAENQLKLASLNHPAHKAMIVASSGVGVAQAGPHREGGNFWRGGVWQMGWANYFFEEMPLAWPQLPAGLSDEERARLSRTFSIDMSDPVDPSVYQEKRMHLPMNALARAVGAPDTELEDYLARGPFSPEWAKDRVTDADIIRVPGLWAEALYDISAPAAAAYFETVRKANPPGAQAIVITNGRHCSFNEPLAVIGDRPLGDATFDFDALALAWLDKHLSGNAYAPTPLQPVTAYMAGANRWAGFEAIPHAGLAQTRVFYLSSGGRANTLTGDGFLTEAPPIVAGLDSFAYDPADPVMTHGGQISGMGPDQKDGAFDQRAIESRTDVLVYSSAPLEADLAAFGYVESVLYVASDAPDTDVTVKLVDVAPDGTAWNIADTILRMRYRDAEAKPSFMKAGEVYEISPPPMLVANVFEAGHRVRVEISSSNFPAYARNLNTANDPYSSTEIKIANNQVHHGPDRLSRILLPEVALPSRSIRPS